MLDGRITQPLFFQGGRAPNLLSWSAPVPSPGSYVSGVSCVRGFGSRPHDRVVRLAGGAVSFCRPSAQPDARFQRRESPVVAHRASHCVGSSTMSKKLSLLQEAGYVASAFLRQEILALLQENAARSSSSPLSVISLPREPRSPPWPPPDRAPSLPSPACRSRLLVWITVRSPSQHAVFPFPALPRQKRKA